MTTQEAQYLYDNLNLNKSFKYDVVIIDHIKENLKYKTNIRTTIYHKEEIIYSYDSCIDGRKNIITNPIKSDQFIIVFDKIIECVKSNATYKNILDCSRVIEVKKIEANDILLTKIETIYWGFDNDFNYQSNFEIKFPKYSRFVENTKTIENMFDEFDIKIISRYKGEIFKPNTGSNIRNKIEQYQSEYYLKKEYLELLEQLSKYVKREIKEFTFYLHTSLDLIITAQFC